MVWFNPASMESMEEVKDTDLINKKSALFRNLLITKFRLAERIGNKNSTKATSGDLVENKQLINDLMRDCPDAQIKYSLKKIKAQVRVTKRVREMQTEQNRMLNKFNQGTFVIRDYIRWLLGNQSFMRFFYLIVIWNMIAVVLDIEYGQTKVINEVYFGSNDTTIDTIPNYGIQLNLAIAQNFLGILLLFELASKWFLDFRGYWRSFWNYVDFFVVITTTPFMGTFFGWYQIEFVGDNVLQACRTLVALKLIHELNAMKAVFELLALTMSSMVYVVGFILILTYLCGLIGTTLFDTHQVPEELDAAGHRITSDVKSWEAPYAFSYGLGRSILVIFKLFTLDGWYRFYKSFIEVHEVYSSTAFIFTWVFLSAFLLGNLFPALLITNFQRIRGEIKEEIEHAESVKKKSQELLELGDQLGGGKISPKSILSEETTVGSDNDWHVLRVTSLSETSIHTMDINQAYVDKIFTHQYKKQLHQSMKDETIKSSSDTQLLQGDYPVVTLPADPEDGLLNKRGLGSLLNMIPSQEALPQQQNTNQATALPQNGTDEDLLQPTSTTLYKSAKGSEIREVSEGEDNGGFVPRLPPRRPLPNLPTYLPRSHSLEIPVAGEADSYGSCSSLYGVAGTRQKKHVLALQNLTMTTKTLLEQVARSERPEVQISFGKSMTPEVVPMIPGGNTPYAKKAAGTKAKDTNNNANSSSEEEETPPRRLRGDGSARKEASRQTAGSPTCDHINTNLSLPGTPASWGLNIPPAISSNRPSYNMFDAAAELHRNIASKVSRGSRQLKEKTEERPSGVAATESSKFSSIMQVMKTFAPFKKLKSRRKKEVELVNDQNEVEINVISATPRSSIRPASVGSPKALSNIRPSNMLGPKKPDADILLFNNRRPALGGSLSDEKEVSDTKTAAGLGLLNLHGIKSKLNLLEPQMTKQGQSMKVMRRALGNAAAAKMVPSDFDLNKLKPKIDSLHSLKKVFIHRKRHPERHVQSQWLHSEIRRIMLEQEYKSNKWQDTVHNCHPALTDFEIETEWNDVVLLNFLHTVTELMENLKEREQLLTLLCQSINGFTDDESGKQSEKPKTPSPNNDGWSFLNVVRSKLLTRSQASSVGSNVYEDVEHKNMRSSASFMSAKTAAPCDTQNSRWKAGSPGSVKEKRSSLKVSRESRGENEGERQTFLKLTYYTRNSDTPSTVYQQIPLQSDDQFPQTLITPNDS